MGLLSSGQTTTPFPYALGFFSITYDDFRSMNLRANRFDEGIEIEVDYKGCLMIAGRKSGKASAESALRMALSIRKTVCQQPALPAPTPLPILSIVLLLQQKSQKRLGNHSTTMRISNPLDAILVNLIIKHIGIVSSGQNMRHHFPVELWMSLDSD